MALAFWASVDGAGNTQDTTAGTNFETPCFEQSQPPNRLPFWKPMTSDTTFRQRSKKSLLDPVMRQLNGVSLSSLLGCGIRDSFASIIKLQIKREKSGWRKVKW
ncbi:MAG: hypothetical protein WCO94_07480 [Verrucomicrobiota bacterium]